jgi:hypothetical protein
VIVGESSAAAESVQSSRTSQKQPKNAMAELLPPLISLVGGFALGWFGHRLAMRREKTTRKYDEEIARGERRQRFRLFLGQWRSEVERLGGGGGLVLEYKAKRHLFEAEGAAIDNDFTHEQYREYFPLWMSLCDLPNEKLQAQGGEKALAQAIDNVIRFMDNINI